MAKLISLQSALNEKLQDPAFQRELEEARKGVRFGLALIMRREELGLTQEQLAAITGIKQPMLSRYERGQIPNTPTMQKLASALNAEIVINPSRIRIEPMAILKAA